VKIVKIGNKEFAMKSSAYTQFAYKNETGRNLLTDIQSIIELREKIEKEESINYFEILDNMTELLLKVAYVMALEADKNQIMDYTSFLKSIDNIYDDINWITDVIELACTPISGQLQRVAK